MVLISAIRPRRVAAQARKEDTTVRWLPVLTALAVALTLALPAPVALGRQAGVTTVIEQRFQAADPPADAEVLQVVLDFAPGAWTPAHWHGGPLLVMPIAGEMTVRQQGTERTFKPGELWIEYPGVVHAAGNTTTATATVVVTFLMPKGGRLTSLVQ
jgi:quercetin dioxygenase-like cupin family protein